MPNPDYSLWRSELRNPVDEARRADRPTDPFKMAGFWMIDGARTKPAWPVSIWANDDKTSAFWQIGMSLKNTEADADEFAEFIGSSWLKCVAVDEHDWHVAIETGRWPNGRPARHIGDSEKLDLVPDTPPEQGGNNPVGEDGEPIDLFHQQVTEKIDAALTKALALKFPITTMEDAQKGAEIIETLTGLGKQGEAKRKEQKQPFIDTAAAIDAKWAPVRAASEMIAKLKAVIETFKRAETERLRKEAAQREQDERDRIAEEARAEAARHGQPVDEQEIAAHVEEQIAAAPPPVVEPVRVSTAHGRAISSPKTKTATITDAKALALHLIETGDIELMEALQKRANAAARAKITLPGTEIDP